MPETSLGATSKQTDRSRKWTLRYAHVQEHFGEYAATILTSSAFLFILLCGLLALAWRVGADGGGAIPVARNVLLIILGILCGWVAGLFASPFSSEEKGEFAELKKAIYAFVTGYLLSKLDRFLEDTLFPADRQLGTVWEQAGLFGAAFLTVALWTFIWRKYGFRGKAGGPPKADVPSDPATPEVSTLHSTTA
jgi:hypothetical protein